MRRLIKRNRKGGDSQRDTAPKTSAGNIQTKWAEWMNSRTAKFKRGHWLIALILFILLAGGYNLYLASEGLFTKGKSILLSVYAIHKPWFLSHATEAESENIQAAEYERIHGFKLYMDSLSASPSGKRIYDSILVSRPGLMDSVLFIEKHHRPN